MSNVREFFSRDQFFFWWPFATYTLNDGSRYDMAPPCTFNDIQNVVRKQIVNEDGLNLNILVTDFDEKILKEKERLKDCNMQVGDKIFELWKDIQNEENEKLAKEAEGQIKNQANPEIAADKQQQVVSNEQQSQAQLQQFVSQSQEQQPSSEIPLI